MEGSEDFRRGRMGLGWDLDLGSSKVSMDLRLF